MAVRRVISQAKGDAGHDEQGEGQAEQRIRAKIEEGRIVDGDDLPVGDELGNAAPRHHQHQRRHHRLDVARETSSPFHSPHRSAAPSASTITTGSGVLVASVTLPISVVATCRADRSDRTHGEIDAARGDHGGHADRHQHQRRPAVEDVDQAAKEVAVLDLQPKEVGRERRN
jgi:hypothetical protein